MAQRSLLDLTTEARKLLKDTRSSSYRYDDDYLAGVINTAFNDAYRLRPDLFYTGCDITSAELYTATDVVNAAEEFPIDEAYFFPIVWFVVSAVELADDEFTLEGRAQMLMSGYRQAMVGAGG